MDGRAPAVGGSEPGWTDALRGVVDKEIDRDCETLVLSITRQRCNASQNAVVSEQFFKRLLINKIDRITSDKPYSSTPTAANHQLSLANMDTKQPMVIDVCFCHTCGFRYKAKWLVDLLSARLPHTTVTITPVTAPLGSFTVAVDGEMAYEKSCSFHAGEPQPTPDEVGALVCQLTHLALAPAELADYRQLHAGQAKAGMSPPWAIKVFDPRTGAPVRGARFDDWQAQMPARA